MPLTVVIPAVVKAGIVGVRILVYDHIVIADSRIGAAVHAVMKSVLGSGTGILVNDHVVRTTLLAEIIVHDVKNCPYSSATF